MKKTMLAVALAILAASPAHAIDAKYRAKLVRSGCTQVTESQGCNINHTKAQNRAAGFDVDGPKHSGPDYGLSAYIGSYGVFAPNGQRLEQLVIHKNGSVKLNGKEMTVTTTANWLTFKDGANVYTLYRNHHGEWRNTNTGNGGTIGK